MRQKFSFKKIVVKFAAIASALAFAVGQFGGYTSTVLADGITYSTDREGLDLVISGNGKANLDDAANQNIDLSKVQRIVLKESAPTSAIDLNFVNDSRLTSLAEIESEGNRTLDFLPTQADLDVYWNHFQVTEQSIMYVKVKKSVYYTASYYVDGVLKGTSTAVPGGKLKTSLKPEAIENKITTWYTEDGKVYDFDSLVYKSFNLYNTPDGAKANNTTVTSPAITVTTGKPDNDDDDTDTTTETTAATEATSVKVSGTNSTAVANKIKNAAAGSQITVDMSSNKTVAKNVLEAAKGKNVDVVLDMGGYKWTINGASIGSDIHDVNMNVTFKADDIPQEEISEVAGDDSYKTISLDYDGPFGFTGFLSFDVGSANAGKYVNLYYYNADKQLEYQNSGIVDKNGNTSLSFSHASEYVAVISDTKASAATAVKTTSATSPVTADAATAVPFILLIVAAAAMFAATAYKKRDI